MAQHFGARAVVCDIAHRILFECIRILYIDHDAQYLRVLYRNTKVCVKSNGTALAGGRWNFSEGHHYANGGFD
jgi:hypothetical protein